MLQGAAAPTVEQVVSSTRYVSANESVVNPVAAGLIELPAAYTDGTGSVSGVDIASAYSIYFVGEDNNTIPNIMVNVRRLTLVVNPHDVPYRACCSKCLGAYNEKFVHGRPVRGSSH